MLGAGLLVNCLKCLHNSVFDHLAFVSWRPSHLVAVFRLSPDAHQTAGEAKRPDPRRLRGMRARFVLPNVEA